MGNAYWKDILRTIKYGKKRFFSILIIVALGVTMQTGLTAACEDLKYSADALYDEQNLFDLSISSTLGLDEDDLAALQSLDGVLCAEGEYSQTVYTEIDGTMNEAEIHTIGTEINVPTVVEGRLPEAADEIAVNETYLIESGKEVGDTLTFTAKVSGTGDEDDADEDDIVFEEVTYTITAEILNPFDVNNREGSVSFRSTTSVDYTFFVPSSAADTEIYTAIYLTLDGAQELLCYDDAYTELVNNVEALIESEIKVQRQEARYETVTSEAYDSYYDAEAEVGEELADAEAELADARQEIDDAWAEIEDAKAELEDGRAELEDGRTQLEDGKAELEAAKEELKEQEALAEEEFAEAEQEIADGYAEIEANEAELAEALETLEAAEAQIDAAEEELEEQAAQLEATLAELESNEEQLTTAIAQLEAYKELLTSAGTSEEELAAIEAQLLELYENLASVQEGLSQMEAAMEQIEAGREELSASRAEVESSLAQVQAGLSELAAALAALQSGEEELAQQKESAEEQFEEAWQTIGESEQEIAESEQELTDGEEELAEGEQEIADAEEELADAEEELAEGEEEFEEGKEEAYTELADALAEIEDIDMTKWYVQSRTSLSGYSNVESDSASIESIATFFPLIFLIIAILISLTTITRMVEEDRGLIGTYKALGFTNAEIRKKYIIYAVAACVAGSFVGDFCGFVILPKIIFIFFGMMYTVPVYYLRFALASACFGFVLFVAGVLIAVFWAVHTELVQMPAILMRPQAPKHGSRIFLERFRKFWRRLSFLNKVTARNLFRYKKRLLMTIFGITGCTALLVCAFGIKNSVEELMPLQYEHISRYDILAASTADDNEDLISYLDDEENIESWVNLQVETVDLINADGEEESVQMFVIPDDTDISDFIVINPLDADEEDLDGSGVLITKSSSDVLDLGSGDSATIQDLSLNEAEVGIEAVTENYLGDYVYITESLYTELFGEYQPNAVLIRLTDACEDTVAYANEFGANDGVISTTCTQELKDDFSKAFTLMNMVVYVILIMAAALAFVVLFTLSTTNISERGREIATLKVLGFFDREVHLYINKETLILSAIGILVGLPAGYYLSLCLQLILKIPGLYFKITVYPVSYVYSAVIALVFTIIVNQITKRMLNKINMVEALKSVE